MSKSLGKRSKTPGSGIWKEIKKKTGSMSKFRPLENYDVQCYKPTCYSSEHYSHDPEYAYQKDYVQPNPEVKRKNGTETYWKTLESKNKPNSIDSFYEHSSRSPHFYNKPLPTPINDGLSPSSGFCYSISRSYKYQRRNSGSPSNYLKIPKCGCNSGETKIICIPRSSKAMASRKSHLDVHCGPSISISIPVPTPKSFVQTNNKNKNVLLPRPAYVENKGTSKSNGSTSYNHCNFYCTSISTEASTANGVLQKQTQPQEKPKFENNDTKSDLQSNRPATASENPTRKNHWTNSSRRAQSASPNRQKISSMVTNPELCKENVQNNFQSEDSSAPKSNSTTNTTDLENLKCKLLLQGENIQNDKKSNSIQFDVTVMDIKTEKAAVISTQVDENNNVTREKSTNLKRTESESHLVATKNGNFKRNYFQNSHPSLNTKSTNQEQQQKLKYNQSKSKSANNLFTTKIDSFTAALFASIVEEKSRRSNFGKIRYRNRVSQVLTKNRRIRIRNGKSHPIYSEKKANSRIKTNINTNSNENYALGQNDYKNNTNPLKNQNQDVEIPSVLVFASVQEKNEDVDKIPKDVKDSCENSEVKLEVKIKADENTNKTVYNSENTKENDEEKEILESEESDTEPDYPPERFNYFTMNEHNNYYASTKDFPSMNSETVILKTKSFDCIEKKSLFNLKEKVNKMTVNSMSELKPVKECKFKSDSKVYSTSHDLNNQSLQPPTNYKSHSHLISHTPSQNSATETIKLCQLEQHGDTKMASVNLDKYSVSSVSSDSIDPAILKRSKVKLKSRDNDKETFVVRKLLGLKRRHSVKHHCHYHEPQPQPELIVMPLFPQFNPSDEQFKKIVIKKCGDTGKHKVIIYKDNRLGKPRPISCRSQHQQRHASCINCPNCGSSCPPPLLCCHPPPPSNQNPGFQLNDYASILSSAIQNAQQREAQVLFQMHHHQQQQQQQGKPMNPFNFGQFGSLLDYENKNLPVFPYQQQLQQNLATPIPTPSASEIKTVQNQNKSPPPDSNGTAPTIKTTTNPNNNSNLNSEQSKTQPAQAGTTTTHVSFVSPAPSTVDSVPQRLVNPTGVGGTTPSGIPETPQGGGGGMMNQMGGFPGGMNSNIFAGGGIGTPGALGFGMGQTAVNYAYPFWQPPLINEALNALAEAVAKEKACEKAAAEAKAQAKAKNKNGNSEEDCDECEDGINYGVGIPAEWCTFKSTPSCEMTGCQSCRCCSSPNPACCCCSSPRRRVRKKTYTIEPNPLFWGNPKCCASTFKSQLLGRNNNNNNSDNNKDIMNFGSGSSQSGKGGRNGNGNRNRNSSQSSSDSDMEDDSGGGGTFKTKSRHNRKNSRHQNQYQDSESGYASKHDQSYGQGQFENSKGHSRASSRHNFQDLNSTSASHQNLNSFSTLSHFNPLQLPGTPSMDVKPYKLPPVDPFPFFRLPLPARPPRSATFDLDGMRSQPIVKEIHRETSKTFPSSTSQNSNQHEHPNPNHSHHSHHNGESSTLIKTPSKTSTNTASTSSGHHNHHHHHHHHSRNGLGIKKTQEFADLPTKNMSNSPLHRNISTTTHGQLEIHETSYNPTYIINGSKTEKEDIPLSRQPLGLFGPATEDEIQALQAIGAIGQVQPSQVGPGGVIQEERGTSPGPVEQPEQKEKKSENITTTTEPVEQKLEKGKAKGVQVQAKPSMILLLDDCCDNCCDRACSPNSGMRQRRMNMNTNMNRRLRPLGRFDTSASSGEDDDCCCYGTGTGRSPRTNQYQNQNRPTAMPPSCMKPCRKPNKSCCSPCPPPAPPTVRTPIPMISCPRKQSLSCRLRKKKSCRKDPSSEYFVDQQMTAQCFPHVYGGGHQSPPIYSSSPYSPYIQQQQHAHHQHHLQSTMSRGGVANLTVAPQLPPGYQAQIAAEFEAQLIPIVQAQMHRVFQNQCQAVASNIYAGFGCSQQQQQMPMQTSMDLYAGNQFMYPQQPKLQQQQQQPEFPCASPMSMSLPMTMPIPMQYGDDEEEEEDVDERGRRPRQQQRQEQGWHEYQVLSPTQPFQSHRNDYNMCSKSKTSSKRRVTGSRKC